MAMKVMGKTNLSEEWFLFVFVAGDGVQRRMRKLKLKLDISGFSGGKLSPFI